MGGEDACSALKDVGAVYLSAIGGAAQYYAKALEEVEGVDFSGIWRAGSDVAMCALKTFR